MVKAVLFMSILLLIPLSVPVIYSFYECPYMSYYKNRMPKITGMMKYRLEQAREAGRYYKIIYEPVPLKSIAVSMRRAAVAAEDAHFYEHEGIDVDAIKKAYEYNLKKGKIVRGGSTISQQVAKNLWLSPERTLWRKLIEAILTWRMEQALSKERILELYLNIIEWGNGIFGVGAASKVYFDTTPANLSVRQAALLAAVIPSPLHFDPKNPSPKIVRRQARLIIILTGNKAALLDELYAPNSSDMKTSSTTTTLKPSSEGTPSPLEPIIDKAFGKEATPKPSKNESESPISDLIEKSLSEEPKDDSKNKK